MTETAHGQGPKEKAVSITNGTPSERDVRLNTKNKDSVRWTGADKAYDLWFLAGDYAFKRDPDRKQGGYSIIEVKHGKDTHKYVLDYELQPSDPSKRHPYDIMPPGASIPTSGPNGPTIIGEG